MPTLLADRFVPSGASWIDLATGATVRVRLAPARTAGDLLAWMDWCATLAAMRHPLLNVLLDWGHADASRTFEAYAISGPIGAGGAGGARLLAHAARFLEAHGIQLGGASARLALRGVEAGPGRAPCRPLGVVLQPRRALRALDEALAEVAPGGVVLLNVTGIPGSGLRTAFVQAARMARMHGYVPVSAALLAAAPWMTDLVRARHVCVLLDDSVRGSTSAAAALSSRLGVASARRHAIIRFDRSPPGDMAIALEPLGVTAMMSMVFTDRGCGPGEEELLGAARTADGLPGRFLTQLRAAAFPAHRPTFDLVHETAPAYVVERTPAADRARRPVRSIASAGERARRLVMRGRHASAIRLLTRAARVLERRGDDALAARCAEGLGWILRDRGRTQAALEQFARAAALGRGGPQDVRATIATGVAWTDECRFAEAEAAIRSALASAELIRDGALQGRARLALARALHWQRRHDEAAPALAPAFDLLAGASLVRAHALAARIAAASGDLPRAVERAAAALAGARESDPRTLAGAARAMAEAQIALGDVRAARAHIRQGLAAAASAHAPLVALRLRALTLGLPGADGEAAPAPRLPIPGARAGHAIPPLLRRQLERHAAAAAHSQDEQAHRAASPAIPALQQFLELTFGAADDSAAVEAVCRDTCDRLRAATVQVMSGEGDRRLLARAGRPWSGDLRTAERALAGTAGGPVFGVQQPRDAAHAISFAGAAIAVLACRWTLTASLDVNAASAVLGSAALALAPAVRALCDRARLAPPEQAWRELIGTSAPAIALRDAITRAARAPFPVLIEGESGSGKELVARAIHRVSARRDRKLCAVNCAAITDDLLEAELFGHARGAFTGAVGERPGLFEEADGGTLFLDEVGELSARAQAKVLRVLQDGEVRRVGENFPRRVDARVIAATNRRLDDEVEAGRFRADLRFRLDVVRIQVPPLRDRPIDIPVLAAHFWEDAARRVDSRAVLAPETVLALARYDWPGNVRQLQNAIAALAVHAPRRGRVPPSLLPAHVARTAAAGATTFEAAREEFERRFVAAELARAGGHRTRAARALGVTRQGLAKMIRRLGIDG